MLIVRVTPKMVEGFWKRLGREAARTQGADLPPFKDFKTSFRHMRATCAGVEVTPIHPFVLEHRVSEKNVIREGLYVFDPDAFGPQCGTVTLSLYSEAQPERADTLTPTRTVIDQIWNDFAPYRATGRLGAISPPRRGDAGIFFKKQIIVASQHVVAVRQNKASLQELQSSSSTSLA